MNAWFLFLFPVADLYETLDKLFRDNVNANCRLLRNPAIKMTKEKM
jgi:hypothetical protein